MATETGISRFQRDSATENLLGFGRFTQADQSTSPQLLDSRTRYFGVYAQDTFKVRSDLTINYGLRWDTSQPFYDTKDRIQTFVPGVQSKIYPDSPKGFVFPGDPGIPRTLAPTQYNRFAPRLGVAYSPSATDGLLAKIFGGPGKTSIRVGGGLYYTAIEDVTWFNEVGDAPFGLFWVSPVPPDFFDSCSGKMQSCASNHQAWNTLVTSVPTIVEVSGATGRSPCRAWLNGTYQHSGAPGPEQPNWRCAAESFGRQA